MSWNVGRTPPASGYMITAGHGPVPSGVCKLAPKAPSGVVIDTSRCGIRDLLEENCCDVGTSAPSPTTGAPGCSTPAGYHRRRGPLRLPLPDVRRALRGGAPDERGGHLDTVRVLTPFMTAGVGSSSRPGAAPSGGGGCCGGACGCAH